MGVDYYNCEICGDIFADAGHYGHCGNCEATLCGSCYDEMRELNGELGEDHPKAGWYGEEAPCSCNVCNEQLKEDIKKKKVIELFNELSNNPTADEYTFGVLDGIKDTLTLLGIKIEGVNA